LFTKKTVFNACFNLQKQSKGRVVDKTFLFDNIWYVLQVSEKNGMVNFSLTEKLNKKLKCGDFVEKIQSNKPPNPNNIGMLELVKISLI